MDVRPSENMDEKPGLLLNHVQLPEESLLSGSGALGTGGLLSTISQLVPVLTKNSSAQWERKCRQKALDELVKKGRTDANAGINQLCAAHLNFCRAKWKRCGQIFY